MANSPISDKQFNRLTESIDWSAKLFSKPRQDRITAIKNLVGKHYMENGNKKIMPVNGIKLQVDIYTRYLAAKHPRAMLSTDNPDLQPTAIDFELALNQVPDEIGLDNTLERCVTEALISPLGIVKCGLAQVGNIMGYDYGEPFVDNITLDDYFCDMSARDWHLRQYEGNDYWMEYEDFKNLEWDNMKDVGPDEQEFITEDGDAHASSVSVKSNAKPFRERIWLRDIWLPKEGLMLTYGIKTKKLFNVVQYDDGEPNPYMHLGFFWVPGNLLPLPPIASWIDLNELNNALFRKLGYSADAYKRISLFHNGDDNEIMAFKNTRHGEGCKYTGAKPEEVEVGGIDPRSLVFQKLVKEYQSYYSGSIDSLGGLSPMSSTIGQDKLLADSASAQVKKMADKTSDFIKDIFKALAYYEWNNPIKTRTIKKPLPNNAGTINFPWNQESRQGKFTDYNIGINIYSLQDDSPMTQLQKLGAFMQQYVYPAVPAIQQMGGFIDWRFIIKEAARLANFSNIGDKIVQFPDDPIQQDKTNQQQYIGAPKTPQTGEQARVEQQSQDQQMINQLMNM